MNEHELNVCPLAPGDRVILTNAALDICKHVGDPFGDTDVFTVCSTFDDHYGAQAGVRIVRQIPESIQTFRRELLICEHETIEDE